MLFNLCMIFLVVFILLDIYFYKKLPLWAHIDFWMIVMLPCGAIAVYFLLKRRRLL